MRIRLTIAGLIAAASAALVAQSTPPQPDAQPRPTFRAEANYVRVDMYPTRDDRPVEDLTQEEIEILEDGKPQKIATFEYVKVRPAGAQETRIEPNTVEQSRQAAADPRARVFVIFLDTYHTQLEGSHHIRKPVVEFLDRVIGQDDLVAVMTPEMSAADITFGRKTTIISNMMSDDWAWGRRERLVNQDPKEQSYEMCYPEDAPDNVPYVPETKGIAFEMIERRREKLTLDALEDLVVHLSGLREERKAVLTVSEGWRLFGVNRTLSAPIKVPNSSDRIPDGLKPVFVGEGGKIRSGRDPRKDPGTDTASQAECDADRVALAEWDGRIRARDLYDRANRGNVSFYTVYPRGLAVFDAPMGPRQPPPIAGSARRGRHSTPENDAANLSARHHSLRELADATDGLSVINTNALDTAMRRIVSDLTSYYLVGYYSSNDKLDGRFREITVRVKRPGVRVRARRGYRALTPEQLTSAAMGEKPPPSTPVTKAFNSVAVVSPRSQLRIRAASWSAPAAEGRAAAIWVVGEVDYNTRKELAWSAGASAEVVVVAADGADVMSKTIALPAGQSAFTFRVPEAGGVAPGEYAVRVRLKPTQDASLPISDTARVIVPADAGSIGEAVMWRRGPSTGPKHALTADPRFRRNERVRLEHATTAAGTPTARMLDRSGNPINMPVLISERPDESGEFRWLVADATLAPLAPGDYAIELTLDDAKAVTAFKVVP